MEICRDQICLARMVFKILQMHSQWWMASYQVFKTVVKPKIVSVGKTKWIRVRVWTNFKITWWAVWAETNHNLLVNLIQMELWEETIKETQWINNISRWWLWIKTKWWITKTRWISISWISNKLTLTRLTSLRRKGVKSYRYMKI